MPRHIKYAESAKINSEKMRKNFFDFFFRFICLKEIFQFYEQAAREKWPGANIFPIYFFLFIWFYLRQYTKSAAA